MKRLYSLSLLLVLITSSISAQEMNRDQIQSVKDIKNEWYFPEWLGTSPYTPVFEELQWAYGKRLISRPLKESFIVEAINDYQWPAPVCKDLGKRKDNDYKTVPLR